MEPDGIVVAGRRLPAGQAITVEGGTGDVYPGTWTAPARGDGCYKSAPLVDSYHSIWFELHEELIQLAGRTREDEVAAGRA